MNIKELVDLPWEEVQRQLFDNGWQPMDTAPTDQLILGFCMDRADVDETAEDGRLSVYHMHREIFEHLMDGPHVLEWGGSCEERDLIDQTLLSVIPDWWFLYGTEFEKVGKPIAWKPVG